MKIWLTDLTYDQQVIAADTMPTNISFVGLFAQANSKADITLKIFKYPQKFIDAFLRSYETEGIPDVVGFSNFMWNSRLNYQIVERIHKISPKTVIVFGGLHYPAETEQQANWLRDHPLVDFYVYKEGEVAFLHLIDALFDAGMCDKTVKKKGVPGVHFLRKDSSMHSTPPAERVRDLACIPSPYLTGTLDEFFDGKLMPVLTTNRGCPFTCSFCVEGSPYYKKVNRSKLDRVCAEIDYIGKKISENPDANRRDLYISDSNFGMLKEDLDVCIALRESKQKYGWPEYVQATTGKNNKKRVLDAVTLLDGGLRISGSVQTLDKEVMHNIKRDNIRHEDLLWLAKQAGANESNSYSEIILALPGDSLKAHTESLRIVVNSRYDYVLAWQLTILPNTDMDNQEYREKFGMKTRYRVLTKSYGNYLFNKDNPLSVFEFEEVCVEGLHLPFEDYINARKLHLIINVFYNDRFFDGILKILDSLEIDRWNWVAKISDQVESQSALRQVFDKFISETKAELFNSKEELFDEFSNEQSVQSFVDGKIGKNLLADFRLTLIIDNIDAVCQIAIDALRVILKEHQMYSNGMKDFLEELLIFERERRRDLFNPSAEKHSANLCFDLPRFQADKVIKDVEEYRMKGPRNALFRRSSEVTHLLRRNLNTFGNSKAALYKQMTRTHIKKLYRNVVFE